MNPILLILALLFLIPIIIEIRLYVLFKRFSNCVVGKVVSVKKEETFTRTINQILIGGKHNLITVSYLFTYKGKEYKVENDKVLVAPSSQLNALKIGDSIDTYIYTSDNQIKRTWLFKPSLKKIIPFIMLFILLLLVSFLSRDM